MEMQLASIQTKPVHPPRTSTFPLVGSVPNILRKQVDYLFEAHKTYGDLYLLDVGVTTIAMLNHPDHATHVLRDNFRNYSKEGEMWDSIRTLIGDGLVTSQGDQWRRHRRMMQPQFHRRHIMGLTELMISAIDASWQEWDAAAAANQDFDVSKAFAKITMRVIVRTMFGRGLSDADADKLGEDMAFAVDFLLQNMVTQKLPDWMPVPGRKRYAEVLGRIDDFIFTIIEERRTNPDHRGDLLAMLLNLADDESGEPLTDEEIRDEAVTIFAAGYETTAIAMTWAARLLTQHDRIADELRQHVHTIIGDELPSADHVMSLTYPQMVMKEAMRLYPPAYWFWRTAVADDVIQGYHIKAGQMVAIVPLTIHRHPDFWDNPDTFDPQRFSAENERGRHPHAFIPFGAGQRQCIGKDFALMEGALILAQMIQRYRIQAAKKREVNPGLSTTLRSKDGVWVTLEKR